MNDDLVEMQKFAHQCRRVNKPRVFRQPDPKLAIFDLDGTIADIQHRVPLIQQEKPDWIGFYKACSSDKPKENIIELMRIIHHAGIRVIIASGRGAEATAETIMWLGDNHVPYDQLYMRPQDSATPDDILKKIWYTALWRDEDILGVWDDRNKVVKMWRGFGLQVHQVEEGDF